MKLYGRDVSVEQVLALVEERLGRRGATAVGRPPPAPGVEPRVDPLSFSLEKLAEHADATRGLEVESHRAGLEGQAVVLAKRLFRAASQLFINETLARQRLFNGHVVDAYAQLSSEVLRLRARVVELEDASRKAAAGPDGSANPRR